MQIMQGFLAFLLPIVEFVYATSGRHKKSLRHPFCVRMFAGYWLCQSRRGFRRSLLSRLRIGCPFLIVDLRIRFVLSDPFSFVLFSCDCGSGIRVTVFPYLIAISLFSCNGIIFNDTHIMRLHDLALFHL